MQILAQKILPCSNHCEIEIITPKLMPRYSHSVAAEIVTPCSCRDSLLPWWLLRCFYPVAAKTIVPCGGPGIPTHLTFFADHTHHCQNFASHCWLDAYIKVTECLDAYLMVIMHVLACLCGMSLCTWKGFCAAPKV